MPLTTVFLDTFIGTGAITAHTPDVAPAGFTYTNTGSGPNTTLALDGTGHATTVPVGYATGGGALANYSPALEFVYPYTITFIGRPTDTLVSSLTSLVLNSPDSSYINFTIDHNASAPLWSVSVEVQSDAGGYRWFYQSFASAAEHAFVLTVSATDATLTVDAVEVVAASSTEGTMTNAFSSFNIWVDGDDPVPHAYIDEIRVDNSSTAPAPVGIQVPALVPCPQTSTVTPEEGRLLSEGARAPLAARLIERDERQFQTLTWALTAEQSAAFRDWWRTDLIEGGAWFEAPETWPTPEGLVVKVRRFVGAPSWGYMGVGVWQVACDCEVRGGTIPPVLPLPPQWLDIFNGVLNSSLFLHTQNNRLNASVWGYLESQFEHAALLDGAGGIKRNSASSGRAGGYSTFGSVTLASGWRIDFDCTPLESLSISTGGFSDATSLIVSVGASKITIRFRPVTPARAVASVIFTAGGTSASYGVIPGLNAVSMIVEEDGFTPIVNGTQMAKVGSASAISMQLQDATIVLAAVQIESPIFSSTAQRVGIFGYLA